MSAWGLGPQHLAEIEKRELKPWGLELADITPVKVITDPVHGDIHVTRLELDLIDTPPLQRLRRVRQLGTAHLVYPGAVRTRFAHALGTLRAAQDLFDAALAHRVLTGAEDDLFMEWASDDSRYYLEVAEALVLARLGALIHDIGHIPFGHTLEDELGLLQRHDENEERFATLWNQVPAGVRDRIGPELAEEMRWVALSAESVELRSRYPFVHDIVGNTICAIPCQPSPPRTQPTRREPACTP